MCRVIAFLFIGLVMLTGVCHGAEVTLKWNPVVNAQEYTVYWGHATGEYNPGIPVGDVQTYTVPLDSGVYYFTVTASNQYGESGYADEVSCAILDKPTIVTIGFSP